MESSPANGAYGGTHHTVAPDQLAPVSSSRNGNGAITYGGTANGPLSGSLDRASETRREAGQDPVTLFETPIRMRKVNWRALVTADENNSVVIDELERFFKKKTDKLEMIIDPKSRETVLRAFFYQIQHGTDHNSLEVLLLTLMDLLNEVQFTRLDINIVDEIQKLFLLHKLQADDVPAAKCECEEEQPLLSVPPSAVCSADSIITELPAEEDGEEEEDVAGNNNDAGSHWHKTDGCDDLKTSTEALDKFEIDPKQTMPIINPFKTLLARSRSKRPMITLLSLKLTAFLLQSFSPAGKPPQAKQSYHEFVRAVMKRCVHILSQVSQDLKLDKVFGSTEDTGVSSSFQDAVPGDEYEYSSHDDDNGELPVMEHKLRIRALAALAPLCYLLQSQYARKIFHEVHGIDALTEFYSSFIGCDTSALVAPISPLISTASTCPILLAPDVTHQYLFALWLCTYDAPNVSLLVSLGGLDCVALCMRLIGSLKAKTIRLVGFICDNVVLYQEVLARFVGLDAVRTFQSASHQTLSDSEAKESITKFTKELIRYQDSLTNWDAYIAELATGVLQWTPSHKNAVFWSENIHNFDEENFAVLRSLVSIIEKTAKTLSSFESNQGNDQLDSGDAGGTMVRTLAVAIHDIGMYASVHPRGREVISQFFPGVRALIEPYLESDDPELQICALQTCTQMVLARGVQVK